MKNNFKNIFILTILFNICVFSQLQSQSQFVPGEVCISFKSNPIHFPPEICGVFLSFNSELNTVKIDSVILLTYVYGSRQIEHEDTISYDHLQSFEQTSELTFNLPEILKKKLIDIKTYYVGRSIKAFFPEDTTWHYVRTRLGWKMRKLRNSGKILIIKFKSITSAFDVAQSIKKFDFIEYAQANEIVIEF